MPRAKLKQRTDGRFRCWYKGKQFYGQTMKQAYAKRDAYKRAVEGGQNPDRITVRAYIEYWFPLAKSHLSASSQYKAKRLLEILCEYIGELPVQSVKPSNIKQIYTKHFRDLSNDYIIHARAQYNELFDAIMADGFIQSNPSRQKSAAPHKGTEGSHRAITDEERRIIETCAKDHRCHAVAMTMLYAGLRPAEAEALDMKDVDFKKKVIHVCASYHMTTGKNQRVRNNTMKTKTSERVVPLFSPLEACLKGRTGLLIEQKSGGLSATAWVTAWDSYKKQLSKESNTDFRVCPYDLRHTFCTWCRDNGVELNTCIKWMGHKDAKMILKIYDTVRQTRVDAETKKLENAIKKRTKKG